jgi:ABC-type proline/glycine betaine transport system substrate-binding protein
MKVESSKGDVEAVARQWMKDNDAVASAWIRQKG